MQLKSGRPYKEENPLYTIQKIRKQLLKIQCFVYEEFWGNSYENIYSVRITTDNTQGYSGTNGKGQNRLFALASAYVEFMERIQNRLFFSTTSHSRFFLESIKEKTGFIYFPDEKIISKEEFNSLPVDIIDDLFTKNEFFSSVNMYFDRLKENGYPGCLAVPFYDVKNNNIIYLPINLILALVGSNGMAAGNSTAEGLFQALCEIFERYAAYRIFYDRITPPSVPRDYLSQYPAEYRIIQDIEKHGKYKIIVKDFSTEKKYPVLGVVIINKKLNKYRLNVGSDTSFQVALNRCLTELYQGTDNQENLDNRMNPILEKDEDFYFRDDRQSIEKRITEYQKFTIDGTGKFPASLLTGTESYQFNDSPFKSTDSYQKEVKRLVNQMLEQGNNVYIRDVSYLGFPSFLVYIPRLSPVGKKKTGAYDNLSISQLIKMDKIEDLFFPFSECSDEKIRQMVKILDSEKFNRIEMKEVLHLTFKNTSDWDKVPVAYFLVLFWYKLGDMEKAIKNLRLLMEITGNADDDYYSSVLKFFEMKKNAKSDTINYGQLLMQNGVASDIANEILTCFYNKPGLFNFIKIPQCPDCDACDLKSECLTNSSLSLYENINSEMKKNRVNQKDLGDFFYA